MDVSTLPLDILEQKVSDFMLRLKGAPVTPLLKDNITALFAWALGQKIPVCNQISTEDKVIYIAYPLVGKVNHRTKSIEWGTSYPRSATKALAEDYFNGTSFVRQQGNLIFSAPIIYIQTPTSRTFYLPIKTTSGSFKTYIKVLKCSLIEGDAALKFPKRGFLLWYPNKHPCAKPAEVLIEKHTSLYKEFPSIITAAPTLVAKSDECLITRVLSYDRGDVLQLCNSDFFNSCVRISDFFLQTAEILRLLHSRHKAIGDLKLDNIILDDRGRYLLCDIDTVDDTGQPGYGTEDYKAPELRKGKSLYRTISCEGDIWAFGFMLTLFKQGFPSSFIDRDLLSLEKRCLTVLPQCRPTAYEIVRRLQS